MYAKAYVYLPVLGAEPLQIKSVYIADIVQGKEILKCVSKNQGKKMEAWIGVEPIYAILQTAA